MTRRFSDGAPEGGGFTAPQDRREFSRPFGAAEFAAGKPCPFCREPVGSGACDRKCGDADARRDRAKDGRAEEYE